MKLEITGTFMLLAALGIGVGAAMVWSEPALSVISAENGRDYCPTPPTSTRFDNLQASPDLLLLMFGLSQGRGEQG